MTIDEPILLNGRTYVTTQHLLNEFKDLLNTIGRYTTVSKFNGFVRKLPKYSEFLQTMRILEIQVLQDAKIHPEIERRFKVGGYANFMLFDGYAVRNICKELKIQISKSKVVKPLKRVAKTFPNHATVLANLDYDPLTGDLTWKKARGGTKVGDLAGYLDAYGYRVLSLNGCIYKAHRVCWYLYYGVDPGADITIDHVNHIRSDNRIDNLRLATGSQNGQNQVGARSDNLSSGVMGVHYRKSSGKYLAKVTIEGKQHYLGSFDTAEDAHATYLAAKRKLHDYNTL